MRRAAVEPPGTPPLGHLWRWTVDPVGLLADGAARAPVFGLRLWRPVLVGYRPDWNRAVLTDLDTFRSRGSLSDLSPHLSGGVVHTDAPAHRPRRRALNARVGTAAVAGLADRLAGALTGLPPAGEFDARALAATAVRRMLNAALFGGRLDDRLLAAYLSPLDHGLLVALAPRPRLIRRVEAAIGRVLADPPADSLAAGFVGLPDAAEELRVALAAGYDTTAHTLAWALWELAGAPRWRGADAVPLVVDEVLRLYPAGWLGSRIAARDTVAAGVAVPAGTMVCYSPYLTHRDPDLWPAPTAFRPDRFAAGRPAWRYLPFSAGPRTCLGARLAHAMLCAALVPFCRGGLAAVRGDPRPRAGITLRARGPLVLRSTPPRSRTVPVAGAASCPADPPVSR